MPFRVIDKILAKRPQYSEELNIVDLYIEHFISKDCNIQFASNFIVGKGKRIRSILYFHFWNNDHDISEDIKYKTIALIEVIHFASLLHDDVVDNNTVRRNEDSFMVKYGKKISILVGDLLISKVINEFLKLHYQDRIVVNQFLKACSSTAYGGYLEQTLDKESTLDQYIRASSLKTGSLFKLCCFLGTYLSTSDFAKAKKLATYGLCFGIIFQTQNDINCYKFRKFESSEDYTQGTITFPVIVLRDHFEVKQEQLICPNQKNYEKIQTMIDTDDFSDITKFILSKYVCGVDLA